MADPINTHSNHKNHIMARMPTWDTLLRILGSFIIGAFSASFLLGGKSRDVSDMLTFKGKAEAQFAKIDEQFADINRNGTNKSRWTDDNQTLEITANRAALLELGHKVDSNGALISVIQSKVERMESELKDIETRTHK